MQINDSIFAYQFYSGRPEKAKDAERARLEVVKGWAELKAWIGSVNLPEQLECLSQMLVDGWGL